MKGYVIWFTGISGSGKSTLSGMLKKELDNKQVKSYLIDGEYTRDFFENDLGYTEQDRIANLKRCTFAARVISDNGIISIVSAIAPSYRGRDFIRKKLPKYIQVYLELPIEEAIKRDTKGHYKNYMIEKTKNMVGLDAVYEVPRAPDITINTASTDAEKSLDIILSYLEKNKII